MVIDYYTGFERGGMAGFERELRASTPNLDDSIEPEAPPNEPGKGQREDIGAVKAVQLGIEQRREPSSGPQFSSRVEKVKKLSREW